MSFRIGTILYVFAVVVAAVTALGVFGLLCAAIVLAFWGYVYLPKTTSSPMRRFVKALVAVLVLLLLIVLLLPAIQADRTPSRSNLHNSQMKQLTLALLNYAAVNGTSPPAYIADADGKPMHSWRVLILPFIEEQELYDKYDFDEPWDGPNNSKLKSQMPEIYCSPIQRQVKGGFGTEANYFVVVGPQTAWPGAKGLELSKITDDPDKTILLIEASEVGVDWMEPRDLTPAEAVELLTAEPRWHAYDRFLTTEYYLEAVRRSLGFVDGHAEWIGQIAEPDDARALLTIAGGEKLPLDLEQTNTYSETRSVVRWGRVCAVGGLAVLTGLPALWLKRKSTRPEPEQNRLYS